MTFAEAAHHITTYNSYTQMDYHINLLFYKLDIQTTDEWHPTHTAVSPKTTDFKIVRKISNYIQYVIKVE